MALSIRDDTIIKVVQATHQEVNIRYSTSTDITVLM